MITLILLLIPYNGPLLKLYLKLLVISSLCFFKVFLAFFIDSGNFVYCLSDLVGLRMLSKDFSSCDTVTM